MKPILWLTAALASALAAGDLAQGQTGPAFAYPETVAAFLDSTPAAAVRILEANLPQEALDRIEAAMTDTPTDAEQRAIYQDARSLLARLRLGRDDLLLQELTARLAALPPENPGP